MPSCRLWIVATPIGNPGDLSPRARDILASADLILAEDTRRAGLLLKKAGIVPKKMLSFFEHNENERQKEALEALKSGLNVALVTDAGTPLIADPGFRLARTCRENGIVVSPVPGPSAPIAALSAAGIPPIPFTFLGFLPRSTSACADLFQSFRSVPGSLVFFERKNRLAASLDIAARILGEREIAICRELTKEHEEFIVTTLATAQERARDLLGEITVIIGPAPDRGKTAETEVIALVKDALASGLGAKEAARSLKKFVKGWSGSALYDLAIKMGGAPDEK